MRATPLVAVASLLAAGALATSVHAQVNLPPPPPPPLSTDNPPPPPPPSGTGSGSGGSSSGGGTRRRQPSQPTTHHGGGGGERDRGGGGEHAQGTIGTSDQPIPSAGPAERNLSIRLNPLPLAEGVASADGELMFAPHHAVVASPHLVFSAPRFLLAERAFGFAPKGSGGFGTEVGYHYWLARRLEGLWLGPSLIFGFTSPSGPGGKSFGYYGAAFDVGWQIVLEPGFTLDFGGGLLVIDATPVGTQAQVAPRALLGLGWSF